MIGKWMTQLIEWLIGPPDDTVHPTDEEIERLTKEMSVYGKSANSANKR